MKTNYNQVSDKQDNLYLKYLSTINHLFIILKKETSSMANNYISSERWLRHKSFLQEKDQKYENSPPGFKYKYQNLWWCKLLTIVKSFNSCLINSVIMRPTEMVTNKCRFMKSQLKNYSFYQRDTISSDCTSAISTCLYCFYFPVLLNIILPTICVSCFQFCRRLFLHKYTLLALQY